MNVCHLCEDNEKTDKGRSPKGRSRGLPDRLRRGEMESVEDRKVRKGMKDMRSRDQKEVNESVWSD